MADAKELSDEKDKHVTDEKKYDRGSTDKEKQAIEEDGKNTQTLNNFQNQPDTACLDTNHKPKTDIDSFEKLFEAWKNQEISEELMAKKTRTEVELLQKQLATMEQRLKDTNKSNELLQKAVSSFHNDLDWSDKVNADYNALKTKVKQMEEKLNKKENELKSKCNVYEEKLDQQKSECDTMIENIAMKMSKQLDEKEAEMKKQEEEHKQEVENLNEKIAQTEKAKANELAALTVEYEDKFAKLQRLKAASAHAQPQTSSNQEIFRKKLHQLKSEYESETKSLKEQIRFLQRQVANQSQNNIQGRSQAVSPGTCTSFAKRPRKF